MKLIFKSLIIAVILCALSFLAKDGAVVSMLRYGLIGVWLAFVGFTFFFFRDPNPHVPTDQNVILSPGNGTVDVIDETDEPDVMGGKCKRVSMFLSPLDVHVQKAPLTGKISFIRHNPGQFVSAMRTDCGLHNENVLIGIESSEAGFGKIGLRLIAGVLARRIIPFVNKGDATVKGERISLIQFGSRCDVYMPYSADIAVKIGDKVSGGETIIARLHQAPSKV